MNAYFGKQKPVRLIVVLLALISLTAFGCDKNKQETSVTTGASTSQTTIETTSLPEFAAQPKTLEEMYEPQLLAILNRSYKIGDRTISAGEYNYFCVSAFQEMSTYAQYGYYPATDAGTLNLSATCDLTENGAGTWEDYLVEYVLDDIRSNYILCELAKEKGFSISDETAANIDASMADIILQAESYGLTGDSFIEQYCGDQMTVERFRQIIESYYLAEMFSTDFLENYEFSEDELRLPTVRHILYGAPRNGLREEDASEEEIAEALAKAEETISLINGYEDMVLIGDQHTRDETALESAEYTVSRGEMVKEFEEWCFDPAREIGDKEIVRTDFGFHVMYFVGTKEADEDQKAVIARNALGDMIKQMAEEERFMFSE